jgi:methylthioribose-1-phosphate isomerase
MRTVDWQEDHVVMIDQRRLPQALEWLHLHDIPAVAEAITDMAVRGAPAIGATAGFGLALAAARSRADDLPAFRSELDEAATQLRAARPTASNLAWALDRLLGELDSAIERGAFDAEDIDAARAHVLSGARRIAEEDVATNRRMGALGAALLPDVSRVIHHCNTGALATVDYGTALGVVRAAFEAGKRIHVLVDETRPRLQGARLTTWELDRLGVPQTLITDGAAGYHLQRGDIDAVLVGSDRIAANGDVANKIGTYPLAVVARENGVPVYVVAPTSTVDLDTPTGAEIPIEERDPSEVTTVWGSRIAPEGVAAANPAFDVTPHRYVSAIVTEQGVVRAPFTPGLRAAVAAARAATAASQPEDHSA